MTVNNNASWHGLHKLIFNKNLHWKTAFKLLAASNFTVDSAVWTTQASCNQSSKKSSIVEPPWQKNYKRIIGNSFSSFWRNPSFLWNLKKLTYVNRWSLVGSIQTGCQNSTAEESHPSVSTRIYIVYVLCYVWCCSDKTRLWAPRLF